MKMADWQLNQMMPRQMKIHPSTARYDVANATPSTLSKPLESIYH